MRERSEAVSIAKIIDHLLRAKDTDGLARTMHSAVHFDLGDGVYDIPMAPVEMRREARPPYPATLLRFVSGAGEQIVLFLGDDTRSFSIAGAAAMGGREVRVLHPRRFDDGKMIDAEGDSSAEVAYHWAALAINVFAVLACSNVETRDIPASAALNARREARGKLPIHSHKVLVLKAGQKGATTSGGGTHASPRVHLRRGHIRRLPTASVWVQPCVVGDKARGVVTKSYLVCAGTN